MLSLVRTIRRSGVAVWAPLLFCFAAQAQDHNPPASILPNMSGPTNTQGFTVSATYPEGEWNHWWMAAPYMLVHSSFFRGAWAGYWMQEVASMPYVFTYELPSAQPISRLWYRAPVIPADADAGTILGEPTAFMLEGRLNGVWTSLKNAPLGVTESGVYHTWDFAEVTADAVRITLPARVARRSGTATWDVFGWLGINNEGEYDGHNPGGNDDDGGGGDDNTPDDDWSPENVTEALGILAAKLDAFREERQQADAGVAFWQKVAALLLAMTGGAVAQHVIWQSITKGMI